MNKVSRIRLLGVYVVAVLVAYTLATVFSAQSVLSSLDGLGVAVSLAERLQITMHDLISMAGILLPLIATGFAIALPIAGFFSRRNPGKRTALYLLAGALAMLTIHYALQAAFGVIFIAGARTTLGMATQALAGAAGGFAFASWSRVRG